VARISEFFGDLDHPPPFITTKRVIGINVAQWIAVDGDQIGSYPSAIDPT